MGLGLGLDLDLDLLSVWVLDLDLDLDLGLDSVLDKGGDLAGMEISGGMLGLFSSSPSWVDDLLAGEDSRLVGAGWVRNEDISMLRYGYGSWCFNVRGRVSGSSSSLGQWLMA